MSWLRGSQLAILPGDDGIVLQQPDTRSRGPAMIFDQVYEKHDVKIHTGRQSKAMKGVALLACMLN